MLKGEARLAYVAVTRAQRTLDRSGLDWIDDQPGGRHKNGGGRRARGFGVFDDDGYYGRDW